MADTSSRRERGYGNGMLSMPSQHIHTADVFPNKIELKAEDLYDKEKVDLETIVIDDVFKLLQCEDKGLTTEEAQRRLELFGPNKLESEEQNPFLQVGVYSLTYFETRSHGSCT
jgi:hypothetical protein